MIRSISSFSFSSTSAGCASAILRSSSTFIFNPSFSSSSLSFSSLRLTSSRTRAVRVVVEVRKLSSSSAFACSPLSCSSHSAVYPASSSSLTGTAQASLTISSARYSSFSAPPPLTEPKKPVSSMLLASGDLSIYTSNSLSLRKVDREDIAESQ
ncbi:hypothetical protein KC363_g146 [Hortaea werneckii]|nr:hypothetical protein KC363_g146 [Hortaea werneckii]